MKFIKEENELQKRARKHKNKQKGQGWFVNYNAGDVEKSVDFFNHVMGSDNSTATSSGEAGGEGVSCGACESLEEGWSRKDLIDAISARGYNYRFDKYTDQQLFRIYQRIQNKPVKYEEEPVADEFEFPHTPINDPKFNFEDPDREDEYEVE